MKLINVILGLIVLFLGVLPILIQQGILVNYLSSIPSSGNLYQGIIALVGIVIIIMNYKASSDRSLKYRYRR